MMKSCCAILFLAFLMPFTLSAQKVMFLHHSTGNNLFYEGNVAGHIAGYNATSGTNIQVTEFSFPNTPWPWSNYPYDYWKLWIGGSCSNSDPDIRCMDNLAANYDVVIFKHCYPGANIEADLGTPDVASSRKSIENYKAQYRALRSLMDGYPNTDFIVWTLVPLHRLATTPDKAVRAKQFVDWVKSQWLTEDGRAHPNIHIFDVFGLWAEQSPSPANGTQYCLKYVYERSHSGSDSHPNQMANENAGLPFAERIVEIASGSEGLCSEDLDGNQMVDGNDYLMLISRLWQPCSQTCMEDIDGNGSIDGDDFLLLMSTLFVPCF